MEGVSVIYNDDCIISEQDGSNFKINDIIVGFKSRNEYCISLEWLLIALFFGD